MSKVAITGNASGTGTFTIAAPNSNTDRTLTLPDAAGTVVLDSATQTLTNKTLGSGLVAGASLITSGTAVASTSGTSIDFTGIPSWVKRIIVMFNNVSTGGSSNLQIQLGDSGGFETTGYGSSMTYIVNATPATTNIITGFLAGTYGSAIASYNGIITICTLGSNIWASSTLLNDAVSARTFYGSGAKTLSDTLTQVRITTVNGTDAFDAGTINILYE